LLVDRILKGQGKAQVAMQLGISVQTVNKWFKRYQAEGLRGLEDRSDGPESVADRQERGRGTSARV